MILGDRGGGIQLYAARPNNHDWGDTFGEVDPQDGYAELFDGKISIKQFRVLQLGCQFPGPISPGQKLPEYRIYAEGDEVINDCSNLGEPTGFAGNGDEGDVNIEFYPLLVAFLVLIPIVRLKKNRS